MIGPDMNVWYPSDTHFYSFQIDSDYDYDNDNTGRLAAIDVAQTLRRFTELLLSDEILDPELIVYSKQTSANWDPYYIVAREDWRLSWTREQSGDIRELVDAYEDEEHGLGLAGYLKTDADSVRFLVLLPPERPSELPRPSILCAIYGRNKQDADQYSKEIGRLLHLHFHP